MSSSSSSSMGALAAATAMALSGSLVLFSLRRFAKPALDDDAAASDEPAASLRPCLSSSSSEKRPRRKGEKRVRFAEGVVDNEGAAPAARSRSSSSSPSLPPAPEPTCRGNATTAAADHRMPANREALYRGMLRDRSLHRTAYSY